MKLIRKLRKLFGLPDWDGYFNSMNDFYERERKFGMTPEEERELRERENRILRHFGKQSH